MTTSYREQVPDGKFHHRLQRTISDGKDSITLGFEWHGGAYIEVCKRQAFQSPQEVINVWDYAKDEPEIPRTVHAMENRVEEWIRDYGEGSLLHDVLNNWG